MGQPLGFLRLPTVFFTASTMEGMIPSSCCGSAGGEGMRVCHSQFRAGGQGWHQGGQGRHQALNKQASGTRVLTV